MKFVIVPLILSLLLIKPVTTRAEQSSSAASQAPAGAQWAMAQGWLTARLGREPVIQAGAGLAADVMIEDAWLLEGKSPTITVTTPAGGGWRVTYKMAAGELEDRVEPNGVLGKNAWLRKLTYTNLSNARQDLTNARLRLAPCRRPGGLVWQPDPFWMGEAGVNATSPTAAVCIAYKRSTDFSHLSDSGTMVESAVDAAWRLAPGQTATIGSQGVWLGQPGREAFRAEAQRWYRAIGLTIPAGMPDWAHGMILYETGAGGHIDSRFSDVGGFANFEHQLDYLADLGITALWYNSVYQHKTPPSAQAGSWNHYDPLTFKKVDPILGGLSGFKRLVGATRARGLHAIGELVPWGGHSIEAAALPQWWLRDRAGNISKPWGTASMDYASPAWQKIMREALAWLAKDAGIEGARIDCADGNGLHWSSPRTNQASFSSLGGAREMLTAMRAGLATGNASPVIIPETGIERPEYFAIPGTIGYGFSLIFKITALAQGDLSDAVALNAQLRDFFERERGCLPDGALVLRALNNHDTVCDEGRVQQRFGAGLARALYGVCLCVPGVPMLYQEEESGSLEALRRMNWGRRRVPEMITGRPDYLAVRFAPEVFSVLRATTGTCALGLINLSGKRISGRITLPESVRLAPEARAYDAVSGRENLITKRQFALDTGNPTKPASCAWACRPSTGRSRIGPPDVMLAKHHRPPAPPVDTLQVTEDITGVKIKAGGMLLHLGGGDRALGL